MILILTPHSVSRMQSRGITMDELQYAVSNYIFSAPGMDNSTLLMALLPDGREIKVWVSGALPLGDYVIIKTAVWRG